MTRERILALIVTTINEYMESQDREVDVSGDTPLLGAGSELDSMDFVNVLLDVEARLLEEGAELTLASERAMSRRASPFRTASTLADFIIDELRSDG
jgi:acyl carrier protein